MTGGFFSWERFYTAFPKVFEKLPVTIEIVLVATAIGFLLGILLAMIRIKEIPVLNQIAFLWISFFRGTPSLVQMFIVYYGLPVLVRAVSGADISSANRLLFVFITFGMNQSGYMAEVLRTSIQSVPRGQTEAAYSIGLTGWQTFWRIIFPQALKVATPALETMFVTLFQDTALAYMIGVSDMMGKVKNISANTHHSLEGYLCVALIFAVISLLLELIFKAANKKMEYGRKIG